MTASDTLFGEQIARLLNSSGGWPVGVTHPPWQARCGKLAPAIRAARRLKRHSGEFRLLARCGAGAALARFAASLLHDIPPSAPGLHAFEDPSVES